MKLETIQTQKREAWLIVINLIYDQGIQNDVNKFRA